MTRAPSNVVLDANVWGRVVNPKDASGVADWIDSLVASGRNVIVPEISDYEVRRSLLRLSIGTRRWSLYEEMLDSLLYAPITTEAMRIAAEIWAQARLAGKPLTSDERLDGDAILIGQTLSLAPTNRILVATTNVKHIGQYASAEVWREIEV